MAAGRSAYAWIAEFAHGVAQLFEILEAVGTVLIVSAAYQVLAGL